MSEIPAKTGVSTVTRKPARPSTLTLASSTRPSTLTSKVDKKPSTDSARPAPKDVAKTNSKVGTTVRTTERFTPRTGPSLALKTSTTARGSPFKMPKPKTVSGSTGIPRSSPATTRTAPVPRIQITSTSNGHTSTKPNTTSSRLLTPTVASSVRSGSSSSLSNARSTPVVQRSSAAPSMISTNRSVKSSTVNATPKSSAMPLQKQMERQKLRLAQLQHELDVRDEARLIEIRQFNALICMVKHMNEDLGAFEMPSLRAQLQAKDAHLCKLQANVRELQEACAFEQREREREHAEASEEINHANLELKNEEARHKVERDKLLEMFECEAQSTEKLHASQVRDLCTRLDELNLELEKQKAMCVSKDEALEEARKRVQEAEACIQSSKDVAMRKLGDKICFLTQEAESLRVVLELNEQKLRTAQQKLLETQIHEDELQQLTVEHKKLQSQVEQMQIALQLKGETLRKTEREVLELREALEEQSKAQTDLSRKNEELQYVLSESFSASMLDISATPSGLLRQSMTSFGRPNTTGAGARRSSDFSNRTSTSGRPLSYTVGDTYRSADLNGSLDRNSGRLKRKKCLQRDFENARDSYGSEMSSELSGSYGQSNSGEFAMEEGRANVYDASTKNLSASTASAEPVTDHDPPAPVATCRPPPELFDFDIDPQPANSSSVISVIFATQYDVRFFRLQSLHPFDTCKWGKIAAFLRARLSEQTNVETPRLLRPRRPITDRELQLVHSAEFVHSITRSKLALLKAVETPLLSCFPMCLIRRKLLTPFRWHVSGSVLAAYLALRFSYSINVGGGFHHCSANKAAGFCVFADITLMYRFLWTYCDSALRVLIVDLDAHQGNGHELDAQLLDTEQRKCLMIVDLFNYRNYPGDEVAKKQIDKKVELRPHTKDNVYLEYLRINVEEAIEEFSPNIIIYNAGTDVLINDPLGGLDISSDGIIRRDEMMFRFARKHQIPIAMLTSGGYQANNAQIIVDSIMNLLEKGLITRIRLKQTEEA